MVLSEPTLAHTPYRQWAILRQRFLLVHSSRTDPVSDEIAEQIVTILDQVLPQAKAMVARARDEQRIASLVTTKQAVLAVLRADRANDLFAQRGEFSGFKGGVVRSLVSIGDHVLVTVEGFSERHAWLVTAALVENGTDLGIRVANEAVAGETILRHRGAGSFARGESLAELE